MATKAKREENPYAKDGAYLYPSQHGSHKSMVDTTYATKDESMVVCKDYFGLYVTEKWRLDCGLADPNRDASEKYRSKQLKKWAVPQ